MDPLHKIMRFLRDAVGTVLVLALIVVVVAIVA
jgi:hypothetical protein